MEEELPIVGVFEIGNSGRYIGRRCDGCLRILPQEWRKCIHIIGGEGKADSGHFHTIYPCFWQFK